MTSQKPLSEFFVDPGTVDLALVACFERWLREDDQVNGSFYKRLPDFGTECGLDARVFGVSSKATDGRRATSDPPGTAAAPAR